MHDAKLPAAESAIDIDAPIEEVWGVMLDLSRYGDWNPFIVRVDGGAAPQVGSKLRLHVRWAKGGGASPVEEVTKIAPPARNERGGMSACFSYRYTGWIHALYLVRAERTQTLEQAPGGQTHYFTRDAFRGLATPFVPLAAVQEGFERQARALKARAELLAKQRSVAP